MLSDIYKSWVTNKISRMQFWSVFTSWAFDVLCVLLSTREPSASLDARCGHTWNMFLLNVWPDWQLTVWLFSRLQFSFEIMLLAWLPSDNIGAEESIVISGIYFWEAMQKLQFPRSYKDSHHSRTLIDWCLSSSALYANLSRKEPHFSSLYVLHEKVPNYPVSCLPIFSHLSTQCLFTIYAGIFILLSLGGGTQKESPNTRGSTLQNMSTSFKGQSRDP